LKKAIRPLTLLLSLVFLVFAAWDLAKRWESASVEINSVLALLSIIPAALASLIQAWAWIVLIERMAGRKVPIAPALVLYLDSQLARYTPGKVGLPVVRMQGASLLGAKAKTVGSSVLIEMLSWTAVGAVVGFGVLFWQGRSVPGLAGVAGRWALPLLIASVAGLLLLLVLDRRLLPKTLLRVLEIDGQGPLLPVSVPLIQIVYWAAWLVHGYLMGRAMGGSPEAALGGMSFYVLASVAGFVALAAPAGVGVRESVLYLGLRPAIGAAPAVSAAILSRVLSLVVDIAVWLVARLWRRRLPA
jgi:hypothetical protein